MKRRFKLDHTSRPLYLATALAAVLFAFLYCRYVLFPGDMLPPFYYPDDSLSQELFVSEPLSENKAIYEPNNNLYDVYISVFPTEDEDGNLLDFSAFELHTSGDHSYNPTLNCNIQILPEGQTPDPRLDLNQNNATIRVRGNSSRGADLKSYKVCLNPGAGDFFGQTILNINKDDQDVTKIATKLSTDLLTEIDNVTSYRSYFMRLWLRDASQEQQEFVYQGMYMELEQPNKAYFRARNLSSESISLYKAMSFSFRRKSALLDVTDPDYSEEAFEEVLSIRESNGSHQKLLEMVDAVNDTSRDFSKIFAEYFNEDNYLTWLAFNVLLGNDDTVSQNYMLYNYENSSTWYFIHWDFDGSLYFGDYETDRPESLRGIQRAAISTLNRRYFEIPGNIEKLDAKIQELLNTCITREHVTELLESYKPVLKTALPKDPSKLVQRHTLDWRLDYIDSVYDAILRNYDLFKYSNQFPLPGFVAKPWRNANGSVQFAWDPFFSLKGLPISYSVRVYSDRTMQDLIFEATGIKDTRYVLEEGLPNGTYYVIVSGTDSEGWEQINQESLSFWDGTKVRKQHGLLEFTLE